MRVLVTGASGFVGRHLLDELRAAGHETVGFDRAAPAPGAQAFLEGDLTRPADVDRAVASSHADAAVHLGGIASVPASWKDPEATYEVNVGGTVRLLDAFRRHAPHARLVLVSTAHVYGAAAGSEPIGEAAPMRPENPYALSKMAADLAGLLYAERHGMAVMTARPVNHIGPGQSREFVISAFAAQLGALARGEGNGVLRVGNLESRRDFMDVRDTVRGYRLLLERGTGGRAYNMASGRQVRIGEMLDRLCEIAGVRPVIEVDPALFRPTDASPTLDSTRIRREIGWTPERRLEDTLRDVYTDIAG